MSKRAEELSEKYADERLKIVDKELFETGYSRHTKMGVHVFDGSQIEEAFLDGYEQAERDLALTPADIRQIVEIYDECLNLTFEEGKPEYESDGFYEEVLRRFIEKRGKK